MGIFSKRPPIDYDKQEREYRQAKREANKLMAEIRERLENGTATREDKRIFNAGRTRDGQIQ
ncbi:hypothetical protein [Streptomyces roseochromogenus]|uniref:Uncharacterized protein n=1 Tax=Streptomyces roseochromogenus subsp. oscitans DS 12.976 TaxID=1352936 RepID=V6KAT6_STRRC|nr:hypothetical protein [Streptomyces roseochromogenus]EST26104.1 hypothetical protein M878_27565 [Streptomyces roseochromogenus subsp. oscitans DS 12.976]